ncbi:glycosyltransferase family 4 protein [bacterium]|nr:glycosyltransferase family 4 protein [bacterium]MBU4511045.1 glycosyltransferase family 4 protein [bacterium]
MKIALDITPLTRRKRTGIENYIFNLCKNFPLVDKENEYVLFANSFGHYESLKTAAEEVGVRNYQNMSAKISRVPGTFFKLLWKYVHAPSAERLVGGIDIFHASDRLDPPLKKAKLVVTIYDLTPIKFKEFFTEKAARYFAEYFKSVIPKADMVVAISQCTKNDILEYFDIAEDRIQVTPLAANDNYKRILDKEVIDGIKEKYGIDKNYVLFVGTLEPRKNIANLVRAYSILPDYLKRDHLLVICGKKGEYYEEIFKTVEKLGLEDKVIFTGYVPDKDIPLLMNGAEIFVYPTFYEGFGLPLIEAMACGTPVISSNISSIPEVIGNAGILINPNDVEELNDAILKLLTSETLKNQLSKKGLKQARKFSWKTTAKKTVEIYNKIGDI